ncbi:MAG: hypothetical protein WDN27_00455 [Candidatus Saccharibacteria bacterium]
MKSKQLYFVLIGVFTLLAVGLFGIAYGANKILSTQAAKLSKLRADSDIVDTTQATLAKNKKDITKYGELNTIAETIVPQDKDQAEAVREIVNLAASSGISKLSSITFPASTLGTVTPGANNNPNLTQLTPVPGITGVYELPITVSQDQTARVPYGEFTDFLSKLEQNRRTAQVSSITIQPDATSTNLIAFTLVINEFIKP